MPSQLLQNRLIGTHSGTKKGPLLFVFAQIHGNEQAGRQAFERVLEMINDEYDSNGNFAFRGRIVGLIGNLQAAKSGARFISKDLNRSFHLDSILENYTKADLTDENKEAVELVKAVKVEIESYKPEKVYIFDIHTTSASGGTFAIPNDDKASITLGFHINTPIIQGMLQGLQGTVLHFFNQEVFTAFLRKIGSSHLPSQITPLSFEAGQHEDPESVKNAVAAIVNMLRGAEMVPHDQIELKHDLQLIKNSGRLPKLTHLTYRHHIHTGDDFVMRPGYANFTPVKKDEHLADDRHGKILCPKDGFILMPLYQKQGEDGFFLLE